MMLVLSFIAIYLLIDFFEKIDNFMEKGKSMALVGKFFLLSIPFIVEQMGPGLYTLGWGGDLWRAESFQRAGCP